MSETLPGGLRRGVERAVGLSCGFRDYRDMDLTFHAALSLAQGLGSTVMSTVAGNPCCARSPVPSVVLPVLYLSAADVCGSSWAH